MTLPSWGNHPVKLTKNRTPDNRWIYSREIDFEIIGEPWAAYRLKDGGVVRHRSVAQVITELLIADPEHPDETGPDSIPIHLISLRGEDGARAIWVAAHGSSVLSE